MATNVRLRRRLLALSLVLSTAAAPVACGASRPDASESRSGAPAQLPETCSVNGAERECHALVSSDNGVHTCMTGKQSCLAGLWSECRGGDGLLETSFRSRPSGGVGLLALSTARADASACSSPCDPGCVGYDEDAGPTGLDASLRFDALLPFPGTNPGFESKLLAEDCSGGFGGPCENFDTNDRNTASVASACQADTYCSHRSGGSGTGCCTRFAQGQTHDTQPKGSVVCRDALPDLTVSGACILNGQVVVPVCNRGKAAVPAGTTIRASVESASGTLPHKTGGSCYVAGAPTCSITLPAPLAPGDCVQYIENLHCGGALNGNKVLYVNSGATPVAECALDVKDGLSSASDQLGCSNNFTAFNSSQLATCPTLGEPKVLTQQYEATCPKGQRGQWGKLGWLASTPGLYLPPAVDLRSQITFEVRAADRLADGGIGSFTPYALVANTRIGGDPNDCKMSGSVAGCPKDLYAPLGGIPAARYPVLEVRITMTGAGLFNPTLFAWYTAYSCVAAE